MNAFVWQRYSIICSSGIQDNGIWDIVYFAKFGKLGLRIMAFGILGISRTCPFQDNGIRVIVFGKRYIREIGIWEIVQQGIYSNYYRYEVK
jgi:hypothetical protein